MGPTAATAAMLLVAAVAAAATPPSEFEERTRARVYRVGVRIYPSWNTEAGRCLDVGLEDMTVTLRGRRLDPGALQLERLHVPTVHALLVDTSRSMLGDLPVIRRAATSYLEGLDLERDRVLLVSFDSTVVMAQAPTGDRAKLVEALDGLRLGFVTLLEDALFQSVHELAAYPARPVILLLTDGIGLGSLHERADVVALLDEHPDLVVFVIGFDVPPLVGMGPVGIGSARSFLQKLATRTHGRYFEVLTEGRLQQVYRRIREMLETEAILTATDPDPTLPAASPRVRSRQPGCRVITFPVASPSEPLQPKRRAATAAPPSTLTPPNAFRDIDAIRPTSWADPECERFADAERDLESSESLWRIEREGDRMRACLLDLTLDYGALYDPMGERRLRTGSWPGTKTRAVEIDIPRPEALPQRPELLMDRLALFALERRDREIERDPLAIPHELHARPFHDSPMLINGMTLGELQGPFARELYERPDYRAWLDERLRRETERAFSALVDVYRSRFPELDDTRLRVAAAASEPGRRIRARAGSPSDADLRHYLASWLGDVSAYDLFTRWEMQHIDRLLAGNPDPGFHDLRAALRELMFVPSYVRTLTLAAPGRDPETDRIGFWRVILPRLSWIDVRLKNWKRPPGVAEIPLDLIPDVAFGARLVETLLEASPTLAVRLREGYRTQALRYELRGKPGKRDPLRAFRKTRIELTLAPDGDTAASLHLLADLDLDRSAAGPRIVALVPSGDRTPELVHLVARVAERRVTLASERPRTAAR